jgi:hypothetical protein
MFIVSRIDKQTSEKHKARRTFLQTKMEEMLEKEGTSIKDQNFFTIDSLLWPKSEIIFIDAVQFILRDLKFRVSAGVNYRSVDRLAKSLTSDDFGLEILICERDLEDSSQDRPGPSSSSKRRRGRKRLSLLQAPLSISAVGEERCSMFQRPGKRSGQKSYDFHDRLSPLPAWEGQEAEIDIFKIFKTIYSHPGGIFPPKAMKNSLSLSFDLRNNYPLLTDANALNKLMVRCCERCRFASASAVTLLRFAGRILPLPAP